MTSEMVAVGATEAVVTTEAGKEVGAMARMVEVVVAVALAVGPKDVAR